MVLHLDRSSTGRNQRDIACCAAGPPEAHWQAIAEHKVTHLSGAPIVCRRSSQHRRRDRRIRPPRRVLHGRGPPPEAVLAAMAKSGIAMVSPRPMVPPWWRTSGATNGTKCQRPTEPRRLGKGVPYHALDTLAVMDPQTMTPVPADGQTIGEVMFRGNVVMKGYLKNKAATDESFAGGWFHSGDLGVMHPDGYLQIRDRSKDIIISGGENISSIEVEDALYKHPAVAAAAVVAKPDEKWGETPCAFVELRPGASASADELIAWCREQLARYKAPRHIVFMDLPKTSTGKIQKYKLRELAKASGSLVSAAEP
ncbi:MAG: AMP-binding protein [Bauldia sp.]